MICPEHNTYFCAKDECVKAREKKLKIKLVDAVKEIAAEFDDPAMAANAELIVDIAGFDTLDAMIAAANAIVPHDVEISKAEAEPYKLSQLDPTHTDPPSDDASSAPSEIKVESHSGDPDPTEYGKARVAVSRPSKKRK